jgi:hypothetical protein
MKMKNFKLLTKARYCGYILLVTGLFSCLEKQEPRNHPNFGQWILGYSNNNGWSRQVIVCDSLQMVTDKEAYVYVKGTKTHIFANKFYPMFTPCN